MNATWTDPKVIKQYFALHGCSFIAFSFLWSESKFSLQFLQICRYHVG